MIVRYAKLKYDVNQWARHSIVHFKRSLDKSRVDVNTENFPPFFCYFYTVLYNLGAILNFRQI